MSGDTSGLFDGSDYGSVESQIEAATGINSGSVFDTTKTPDTQTTNAIQSMAPSTGTNTVSGSSWDGFWQGVLGGAVKTTEAVALRNNGVTTPTTTVVAATPASTGNGLTLFLIIAVIALVATHKG